MPRTFPTRRALRHHLAMHTPARDGGKGAGPRPLRSSDLVMAILGVALLGALALMAAYALATGA